MARFCALLTLALAVVVLGPEEHPGLSRGDRRGLAEVVVTLNSPPLAEAGARGAARIDGEQQSFRRALDARLPDARIRWRYRLVANGFAVALPAREVTLLRTLPAVRSVYTSVSYGPGRTESPGDIGAPTIWGPNLETAGQGIKIGIIDSGVDQRHGFFDPTGYSMPAGFPKGQGKFTTAKVIVARSFPPPGAPASSGLPFVQGDSSHGTHVAGIAAGNAGTRATGGLIVSGVAPKAYIGNYKVFVPTVSGASPNANSPEIVAAVEAAVADGMNVINFSGGENEIEPSRDIVTRALDAAAAAGVVPVVAAGNSGDDGEGSVTSPGSSAAAITVGAVEMDGTPTVADFSSVGPTPISLRLKPDVAAPGVDVLSSVPGGWADFSGTSMAAPHIAGAAALLHERHPEWTVSEIKSALVNTTIDAGRSRGSGFASPLSDGGGFVSLPRADVPLLFAQPSGISFGLVPRGTGVTDTVKLTDAGGGAGTWSVSLDRLRAPSGTKVVLPHSVPVPGTLSVDLVTTGSAALGDVTGLILLEGMETRRIPFWGHIEAPALARHSPLALARPGLHTGTTRRQPALVSRYRYPMNPRGVRTLLAGPETVYRLHLAKRVANFGVVVVRRARGAAVEPRVVSGMDENRLTGYAALPIDENPYLETFESPVLAAGALSPVPGDYGIVFDSAKRSGAGGFTFRFWINDVTPPSARLRTRTVRVGQAVVVAASDAGSGVYPASIRATIDGKPTTARFQSGLVRVSTSHVSAGRHSLRLWVSDYQESRNNENVARILPNTRVLTTTITIQR